MAAAGAAVETGKQEVLGTGNEDADAALGALGITGEVRPWDGQVSDAINKGDESPILLAISDYPNDPHYYSALAVAQLSKGKGIYAVKTFKQAEDLTKAARKGQTDAATAADKMQTRDILPLLEQSIKHQNEDGTTEDGKISVLSNYCSGVRHMKDRYSETYWETRAKTKVNIDCEQYRQEGRIDHRARALSAADQDRPQQVRRTVVEWAGGRWPPAGRPPDLMRPEEPWQCL